MACERFHEAWPQPRAAEKDWRVPERFDDEACQWRLRWSEEWVKPAW